MVRPLWMGGERGSPLRFSLSETLLRDDGLLDHECRHLRSGAFVGKSWAIGDSSQGRKVMGARIVLTPQKALTAGSDHGKSVLGSNCRTPLGRNVPENQSVPDDVLRLVLRPEREVERGEKIAEPRRCPFLAVPQMEGDGASFPPEEEQHLDATVIIGALTR